MTGLSRRSLLAGCGATAGTALVVCTTTDLGRPAPPLGLVDITIMRKLLQDYGGTLQQLVPMGYSVFGFRLTGYSGGLDPGEPPPEMKARLVREAGLEVGVVRLGVRNVDYDRQLGEARDIGAKVVAMTTAPPFLAGPRLFETTRAQFEAWLPELAALGEKARRRGLILAYHNHPHDFVPLSGEIPLDLMVKTIPPELLSFELDIAWAWLAGVPPLDLLARLGSRVVAMHWKDVDRSRGKSRSEMAVALSTGEMNYPALLPHVRRLTDAPGYIEVDSPPDGLAAARLGAAVVQRAFGWG